jgi:uncharacterized protein YneF (UPF0154 family)
MKTTKLILLLLTALLAGICIGFFTNSAIIQARIRDYSQIPADMPKRITDRLTERLELNEEQQKQVYGVLPPMKGACRKPASKAKPFSTPCSPI